MRVDRFLANLKYGSRTEVRDLISQGRVTVNGVPVTDPATLVDPDNDPVEVDGVKVFYRRWIYLMVNKPQGVLSANKDDRLPTVVGLLKDPFDRFDLDLCGRLDLDTEGLVLLTNDGEYLHQVISPKKDVLKTYEAVLAKPLGDVSPLETGVTLLDGKNNPYRTKPAKIERISETVCRISIGEGKYHEVKRMFEAIGNEVLALKRLSIGGLVLDPSLAPGEYKELSFSEVQAVFR